MVCVCVCIVCIVSYNMLLGDCSNQLMEEKRRLENRITQLEEDLEEEQMTAETSSEKSRKALQQVMSNCL